LSSQVFELTDYSQYQPMKKKQLDINNMRDKQRKNDHMYSDILGGSSGGKKSMSNLHAG
jgi:hypothetical protein